MEYKRFSQIDLNHKCVQNVMIDALSDQVPVIEILEVNS